MQSSISYGANSMFVVIFRARANQLDHEYAQVAQRMRRLALAEFGCVEFDAVTEGTNEIALSYWHDEESIRAWKLQAEHVIAQELGRERWYESYTVQICEIRRQYQFPPGVSE